MKDKPNPFEQDVSVPADRTAPEHASDDPGRTYAAPATTDNERTQSSGPSGPSEPRRPGTGERQAPRRARGAGPSAPVIPGEIVYADGAIEINAGLEVTVLAVVNAADRPIQVGSHFHFAEVNAALEFDRKAAWGKRLSVLSGGSVRFEPGATVEVGLVPIQGRRVVRGLRGLCGGSLDG